MDISDKKIGIWGFGVVGKAAAAYLHSTCQTIEVLDHRTLTDSEQVLITQLGAQAVKADSAKDIEEFLKRNDLIVVSPGIDTRQYAHHADKFIAELDLFHANYKKPIIAITGSVGKTTVTTLLSHIIATHDKAWWTGGNIGTSVLDAIGIQDQTHGAIIEVSSFQLDQCKTFAPDIAIVTNVYPNHLDRHGNIASYTEAKAKIFTHQQTCQGALVPLNLMSQFKPFKSAESVMHYFSENKPDDDTLASIANDSILFYLHEGIIRAYHNGDSVDLVALSNLPDITFEQNWLIVCAILFLCELPLDTVGQIVSTIQLPAHRLEKVATINNIDIYNDSKGTTVAATKAAVAKLKNKPIILILGGLGKGVDRSGFIHDLASCVKAIVCFGNEREALAAACAQNNISHRTTQTLDDALGASLELAAPGDQIVMSPAGTSYDQFANYEERGNYFKQLVAQKERSQQFAP